jgi:hypothetical protein
MNQVIAWAGFLGAWLLVAGPLYQGAIELREEDVDREAIEATKAKVQRPDSPSPWWWLVPPVMYVLWRRRSAAYRQAALAQLNPVQREQFTTFVNKANGWFTVAAGASLLAADQSWTVIERSRWPAWLFWVLIVVMLGACVLNTALRMSSEDAARAEVQEPA